MYGETFVWGGQLIMIGELLSPPTAKMLCELLSGGTSVLRIQVPVSSLLYHLIVCLWARDMSCSMHI